MNKKMLLVIGCWCLVASFFAAPVLASAVSVPQKKIRILIVPGHEPDSGGTSFRGLKERDLNVILGQDLRKYLQADGRYDVLMTRDAKGWNPIFAKYLKDGRDDIIAWRNAAMRNMAGLIVSGAAPKPISQVDHNVADPDVSVELYGINKWADENGVDVTVHVHFNEHRDYPSRVPGQYSGFTIYVPAPQYANGSATRAIAEKVFGRLSKYDPVSDLAGESDGVVDEPNLIAVGEDNTANAPSMLIEYGYMYEKRFTDPVIRSLALNDLAYQTYVGLRDAFGQEDKLDPFGTSVLPHSWRVAMARGAGHAVDVFALQTALISSGEYPPARMGKNDCPRSGVFGNCTVAALDAFQRRYGIKGEAGYAGKKTVAKLNGLFSSQLLSKR